MCSMWRTLAWCLDCRLQQACRVPEAPARIAISCIIPLDHQLQKWGAGRYDPICSFETGLLGTSCCGTYTGACVRVTIADSPELEYAWRKLPSRNGLATHTLEVQVWIVCGTRTSIGGPVLWNPHTPRLLDRVALLLARSRVRGLLICQTLDKSPVGPDCFRGLCHLLLFQSRTLQRSFVGPLLQALALCSVLTGAHASLRSIIWIAEPSISRQLARLAPKRPRTQHNPPSNFVFPGNN